MHNIIAKGTVDEWVDELLNAKYQAAQLTQGDISREQFNSGYTYDLSGALAQILSPRHVTHMSHEAIEGNSYESRKGKDTPRRDHSIQR